MLLLKKSKNSCSPVGYKGIFSTNLYTFFLFTITYENTHWESRNILQEDKDDENIRIKNKINIILFLNLLSCFPIPIIEIIFIKVFFFLLKFLSGSTRITAINIDSITLFLQINFIKNKIKLSLCQKRI